MQFAEKRFVAEKFFRNIIVVVDPNHVKGGVASELNSMCLQYAQENNIRHLLATCTYALPANILARCCGYREHAKVSYDSIARTGGDIHKLTGAAAPAVYNSPGQFNARQLECLSRLNREHGHLRVMVLEL